MKKAIFLAAVLMLPVGFAGAASVDYYLKIDGVDGETKSSSSSGTSLTVQGSLTVESGKAAVGSTIVLDASKSADDGTISRFLWKQVDGPSVKITNAATQKASFTPSQAGTYVFELSVTKESGTTAVERRVEVIVGDPDFDLLNVTSSDDGEQEKKGNVEYEWKVEEGTKATEEESGEKGGTEDINIGVGELQNTGIEPDEIDFMGEGKLVTNFGVLLGGGDDDSDGDDEKAREIHDAVVEILLQGAAEAEMPIEQISLNFEKINATVPYAVRIFGFIPATVRAHVEIDGEDHVKVRFPWWAFFASNTGKENKEEVGERAYSTLSNVLKAKHDTAMNAIRNLK
jgi:hypothetical protein